MAFELFTFFAGLVAWVPRSRNGKEVAMTALLPRVGAHTTTSTGNHIHAHHAGLVALAGGCTGDCASPGNELRDLHRRFPLPEELEPRAGAARLHGGALEGVEVSFVARVKEGSQYQRVTDLRPMGPGGRLAPWPETRAIKADTSFVPEMAEICLADPVLQGAQRVEQSLLAGEVSGERLAARLHLDFGLLGVHEQVQIPGPSSTTLAPAFEMRPLGRPEPSMERYQAMADLLLSRAVLGGDHLEVRRGNGQGDTSWMKLAPYETVGGHRVLVLLVLNRPPYLPGPALEAQADHFELFYDLPQGPVLRPMRPVPTLHPENPRPSPGPGDFSPPGGLGRLSPKVPLFAGYGRPICPMALFSPEPSD